MSIDAARVDRSLAVIVAATGGDFDQRVPLLDVEDPLLELEVGINYLLDELRQQQREKDAQHQSLREQAAQLAGQAEALMVALSTPIIVLWPGVLVLPLIGDFDSERTARTTAILLDRVASERATHVILDLTGVESITAGTASSLLGMTRSTRLLGVACFVTGVHAKTARQFIDLGADLSGMRTLARVSDALEIVLADKRERG